jgi:hypothetical protein
MLAFLPTGQAGRGVGVAVVRQRGLVLLWIALQEHESEPPRGLRGLATAGRDGRWWHPVSKRCRGSGALPGDVPGQVSVLVAQTAEVRGPVADLLAGGGRRWWRGRNPTGRFPTLAGRVQTGHR